MVRIAILASSLLLAGCNASLVPSVEASHPPADQTPVGSIDAAAAAAANSNVPELDCRPSQGEILC